MKAVVMAGGEGSRLRPLTSNRPKPLVPVGNQPIMEHILGLLSRHGITDVVATLHYLADEIQSRFEDGGDYGVSLKYSVEAAPLGTAGSVKQAEALLNDEAFVIISGDALTDCDLEKAIAWHKSKGSVATLILYRVPNPLEFGVVITDEQGRVTRFLEKPSWSEVFSDTVNTGMYILEPEVLALMEPGRAYDWSQDIFPEMLERGMPIYGYVMEEYWSDVGTLAQYREAQEHLLSGRVHLPLLGAEIQSAVWAGPNAQIDEEATLVPPVCLGRNVKIKRNARIGPYTVVGDNALIEEGAVVERSVLWENAYIGPNVGVHSATLCARVTVKRDSAVREEAVIGDRCLIDVNSTIRPRVKLWPEKVIERGSIVTMSLIWGHRWRGNLFRELGVAGLSNIEITPDFATRIGSAFGSTFPGRSKIVTSRDSTRSSRMIKRAVIASLLSVGCDVLDLRSTAAPIARHFIKAGGAQGAIHIRKLPESSRVTSIEMFDKRGAYLTKGHERKVEAAFFREDFHRIDPDDLGVIEFASRAVEEYQNDFFHLLNPVQGGRRLRTVCDYGYSSISAIYPAMLGQLGVETISVNSYNDAKRSPRSEIEVQSHIDNLKQIVGTLGYDMGVLFLADGERLRLIDNEGNTIGGNNLFAALCLLIAKTRNAPTIAMTVTAPTRLEELLLRENAKVIRTRADTRSLMAASLDAQVDFGGDDDGGFMYPPLHAGFDGMYSLSLLVTMLQRTGLSLTDVEDALPPFHLAYGTTRCPWEAKGAVMRQLAEEQRDGERIELVDGIKVYDKDSWVLVLPDAVEPLFHIYAESEEQDRSQALVEEVAQKIGAMQAE